jgi:cytochrome P450 family 135
MIDLPPKLILKIAVSVPDSAMPQWKPPCHDLLKAAASDQAVIGFKLRSVGAVRLWPRFQPALHMCNCFVFDEIARRRCHPELEHNDLLDLLMRANGEPLSDNELRD